MPTGLRRYHQEGDLHFITCSCFRKRPIFDTPEPRDAFLNILEETRRKLNFDVHGFVVMPTHVHLLLSGQPSKPMQVVKQRFSRTRIEEFVWEPRYHDFNVRSHNKAVEKLGYMHMNPVTAGLVDAPAEWRWSSYAAHFRGEGHVIQIAELLGGRPTS